jgi:hypothetical protein
MMLNENKQAIRYTAEISKAEVAYERTANYFSLLYPHAQVL